MKEIILFPVLFLTLNANVFSQTYPENVRIVCVCEAHKSNYLPIFRYGSDAQPVIIAPNCPIHKPLTTAAPKGVYLFKKKKKNTTRRTKGTHIIWL